MPRHLFLSRGLFALALSAWSCTAPGPIDNPPAAAPVADRPACEAMTRGECMASPACTLAPISTRPANDYRCRPAEPPCEADIVQATLADPGSASRRVCEARAGCAYVEARCYCPCRGAARTAVPDGAEAPGCNCACGGGPPATCAAVDPPPPPGPADEVMFGESVGGLALGVAVGGPDFATRAPITVTLALKNTSSAPIEVNSHVETDEVHLDWFALELAYPLPTRPGGPCSAAFEGQQLRRLRVALLDDRDESARVRKTLVPGEVLTHRVDLRGWFARAVNGGQPLGPGRYRLSAHYRVQASDGAWVGELSAPPRPLTIAGPPAPDMCGSFVGP